MDLKLVPTRVLDTLICHQCFSYMTVLPISVQPSGQQLCGRCIPAKNNFRSRKPFCIVEEDFRWEDVYNLPVALLGYMAYCYAFPCTNKLQGCDKLLKLEEVEGHEQSCLYQQKTLRCPLCEFQGGGTQLVNHFKHCHHKFHQNSAQLALNTANSYTDTILYLYQDVLLLVKVLFEPETGHVSLDISCISNISASRIVRLLFRVKYGTKRFDVLSERLNVSTGHSYQISFQINDFHLLDAKSVNCAFSVSS